MKGDPAPNEQEDCERNHQDSVAEGKVNQLVNHKLWRRELWREIEDLHNVVKI